MYVANRYNQHRVQPLIVSEVEVIFESAVLLNTPLQKIIPSVKVVFLQ